MKVKDMNKRFKYFTIKYWKDYKRLKHILKCIKKAKYEFIKERNKKIPNYNLGLCYFLSKELFGTFSFYDEINYIIPIFTPEFFNIRNEKKYQHWWITADKKSRIEAFDKLINHYERLIKEL